MYESVRLSDDRRRTGLLTLLLLAVLSMQGCRDESGSGGDAPDSQSSETTDDSSRIRRVAAADWVDFAVIDPPTEPGWIALPPAVEGPPFQTARDPAATGILPPSACSECHADIVESFARTAHARTSQLPTHDSILGALNRPKNRLMTAVDGFYFEMSERDGRFWQELFVPENPGEAVLKRPVEIVIGSGNHGQAYLHREGDQLCQMHVSYYSEFDQWTNSPGMYTDGTADFARPATDRCLDCHATWLGHKPGSVNQFDLSGFIPGVTCVRCHGPARDHIQFHRLQPDESEPQFIVNPGTLERVRLHDVCAQCHAGGGELRRPAFSYVPGEPLESWLAVDVTADNGHNEDPHSANQLARLMQSACYRSSDQLSCISCHDPHQHERGDDALYSRRCAQCHQPDRCGVHERLGSVIDDRCVQCHMPSQRDASVSAATDSDALVPLLRDHRIGIWPDVTALVERAIAAEPAASGPEF